ncbi:MAG TPA: ArgE/DapE family deacylase [Homoserinimonas sp.]|nr:ArgE/DapE family deacylase [Homoserinimonas sp.]
MNAGTSSSRLLAELIAIDSSNPDLVPGAAGESAIAGFVSGWLQARGFEIHRLEERSGRPSIVAIAAGSGGGRSLMLNGHLDTVTLAGYDGDPLEPVIRDGSMHGRGAFDMKSGMAAMMVAAAEAATRPHAGDILLALVADEEYGSAGTEEVLRHFRADAAIVTEPSHLEVTLAHRGFAWFDVTIDGVAAHGSRPDLGVDAIAKAGYFLVEVDRWAHSLANGHAHPVLGTGSVHASVITGGEEISSYPARCTVSIERRTVPGENADTVEAELRRMLDGIRSTQPDFRYRIERGIERQPFQVADTELIVQTTLATVERLTGKPAVRRGEPFWTDCALLSEAGIPCLLFGVDGGGAHAATEWVTLDSLETVTRVLHDVIIDFCGTTEAA